MATRSVPCWWMIVAVSSAVFIASTAGLLIRFAKVGSDGAYRYAYATLQSNRQDYTILDENLEIIDDAVSTVSPLIRTGNHDFQILDDGNYLFLAYEPATRDLSDLDLPYPDGVDVSSVDVEDSAVQIVTPGGRAVFNWNSWDHMALEDCVQHRFPVVFPGAPAGTEANPDYAHLNGVDVADGVLVGSLQGQG